jgi:serine/threonine protein kinase
MVLPMELASGGDLRRLRGAGFLEILPVLLEIAQALEHAHERGIVHRDLKPGNVLFDARGRPLLADFGVARIAPTAAEAQGSGPALTRNIDRHGFSPFTASPAQLRGEPPTPADDIYGLGAVAYELLSGYPPYYPRFDQKRAIEEPVPTLVPTRQIPPLLSSLIMKMLEKDPKSRPRTMRQVIGELDASLNDTLTYDFESPPPETPTKPPGKSAHAQPLATIADFASAAPVEPVSRATVASNVSLTFERRTANAAQESLVVKLDERLLQKQSAETREFSVDVWLSEGVEQGQEWAIQEALIELLNDVDWVPLPSEDPQIGSFFQNLRFLGKVGDYSKRVIANLQTAFAATTTNQKIDSIGKLSKILGKNNHAVLRVENVIAVKTTRRRETFVVVMEIPPALEKRLNEDPGLIRDADTLYTLLTEHRTAIASTDGRKGAGPQSRTPKVNPGPHY